MFTYQTMKFNSKLPSSKETIFSTMSLLSNKYNAINLGQGFPDFECDQKLLTWVNFYLNQGKNQYCPMSGAFELRKAIGDKILKTMNVKIDIDHQLCVTAGATQAIFTAITAFVHTGDEVIVIEPAYDCYIPSIKICGGIPKVYTMKSPDFKINWDGVANMINAKTRMIIINTPHNPTGTILDRDDMKTLENMVANTNIVVLSDEVYEHIIFDGHIHESVLKYPKLAMQSLAVYSFGKTFHVTGWKIGYIVGNKHLMNEYKKIHQWNVFCVNSFLQYAFASYMQEKTSYDDLSKIYTKKRDHLITLLKDTPLKCKPSKGSYFQLYNYENISDMNDVNFAKYLTQTLGVTTIPLSPFYSHGNGNEKMVRLCFAKKNSTLDQAAERLQQITKIS